MMYIVGDHAVINKGSYRSGRKNILVKILEIGPETLVYNNYTKEIMDQTEIKVQTICNADTGKKRKTTFTTSRSALICLETFLDEKRALIKALEGYL